MRIALFGEAGLQHVYEVSSEDRLEALREAWRLHTGNPSSNELPPPEAHAHALLDSRHLGTYDRVYGGNPELVHIRDGKRKDFGMAVADYVGRVMQAQAELNPAGKALCPGCYMIALYDAAVYLANENGQSLSELGHTMAHIFTQLAHGDINTTEEIEVIVDKDEPLGDRKVNWLKDGLVEQPPADGHFHEEPKSSRVAPLVGLEQAVQ